MTKAWNYFAGCNGCAGGRTEGHRSACCNIT